MLADKDCTIFLVIAGSTSAGGCMDLYAELVRNNMVDGVVATGASIVDMDFFEGLGHKHYQALEVPDDDTLRSLYIDRIYDTYIDEEQLQDCDHTIYEIANELEPQAPIRAAPSSARWASISSSTARRTTASSSSPMSMTCRSSARRSSTARPASAWSSTRSTATKAGKPYMVLDAIADFRELTDIKIKAGTTGLLMIGGGVPKNFIQDTVVCAEILGHDDVAGAQICGADHRRRRARRRLLVLDAAGGGELGQGQHRHRADGVRRGRLGDAAARQRRLSPRPLEDPTPRRWAKLFD